MTTGAQVFFKNKKDKMNCIKILEKINLNKKFFFEVQNFKNKNKIFFKFNIYLKNYRNNINKYSIKKLYNDIGVFNIFKNLNIETTDFPTILSILNNVMPGKSTSEHISRGVMFNKNFNINKNKIENLKLFDYIHKYFNKNK